MCTYITVRTLDGQAAGKIEYRFPKAHKKAVVMSYDDGSEHDRRLVGIFNTYGVRGTLHLNSSGLGRDNRPRGGGTGSRRRRHGSPLTAGVEKVDIFASIQKAARRRTG
jgi:hypothetical protein